MEAVSLLQTFALDNHGKVISVEEAERGLACECTCPACAKSVIARKGDIRAWHFAHASGADCPGGAETALHRAAKQIIQEAGGLTLPGFSISRRIELQDGRCGEGRAEVLTGWRQFEEVQLEVRIENRRPDIVGYMDGTAYLIEIAVTHFVDEEKRLEIQRLDLPAIEINLAIHAKEAWQWEELRASVLYDTAHKDWIHFGQQHALELLAEERARADAESQMISVREPAKKPGTVTIGKECYRVKGKYLELTTLPFGIALWSPYDAAFNVVIKDWAYRFSGTYKPAYRNWLFPQRVRPLLINAIKAAGGFKVW